MLPWILFVATTFVTQITFLNMLIAIMGDTFARVSEVKDQAALQEKIKILADFVIIVGRESIEEGTLSRFVFAITPKTIANDDQSNWESSVSQLKRSIELNFTSMKKSNNKRLAAVMHQMYGHLHAIDEKINDLTAS